MAGGRGARTRAGQANGPGDPYNKTGCGVSPLRQSATAFSNGANVNRQEGFLRAICESPDDDTARLVYADWLDEHIEPASADWTEGARSLRAEFIRLQCAL